MADGTWEAMSLERLRAAKALFKAGFWRDSISRSYYAAYCAGASAVSGRGMSFARGWQNPSHEQLPDLVLNVGRFSKTVRRNVHTRLHFLRHAREDANYRPHAFIGHSFALECIFKAAAVLELLEIFTHETE